MAWEQSKKDLLHRAAMQRPKEAVVEALVVAAEDLDEALDIVRIVLRDPGELGVEQAKAVVTKTHALLARNGR